VVASQFEGEEDMRTFIGVALVVALALRAPGADEKKDEPAIDGKLLVGKWEPRPLKKGELALVEFTKDGKLIALADVGGKGSRAEGTYKLAGNKLTYEVTYMGETVKEAVTITRLTGDELETRDKEGKVDAFRRVAPKDPKPK
jgi:uncharacterized protein (TIGR03066 family)